MCAGNSEVNTETPKYTLTPKVIAYGPTKIQGEGAEKREFFVVEFAPSDMLVGEIYTDTVGYKEKIEALRRAINSHEALLEAAKEARQALHVKGRDTVAIIRHLDAAIALAEGAQS